MSQVPVDPVLPPALPGGPVDLCLRPMVVSDLDAVHAVEQRAYGFPWSRGNFTDSLAAGHAAWLLEAPAVRSTPDRRSARGLPTLCGYYVAMPGYEELHLLNITVLPERQGQGLARHMLAHLDALARQLRAPMLWLEVRESNARARRLYEVWGYTAVGRRKGYYPAGHGLREDAIVMNRPVPASGVADALV